MIVIVFNFAWIVGASRLVGGNDLAASSSSLTALTKQEFCDGNHRVVIDPKYIPELLDYLKYCTVLSKEPNANSFARRQAVIHLFNTATPVIHKAFFDSKTALKHVVVFTKLKHEAVQFANYANKYGDHSMYSRKKVTSNTGTLTYAPGKNEGSYNLNEDLRVCTTILNRQQNTSVKNIIKLSQLPRVAKAARIITFPPFNLSVSVSSEDTPYMILDMYVLAMRCLSFTNLHPNTTVQVSENLISHLKRKVMPFVPPHEFEKAYSDMMVLTGPHQVGRTPQTAVLRNAMKTSVHSSSTTVSTAGTSLALKFQYTTVAYDKGTSTQKKSDILVPNVQPGPKKSFKDSFMELLRGKAKYENSKLVSEKTCHEKTCHEEAFNRRAMITIASILAACGILAIILYCLLFGCCGWTSIAKNCNEELDEVDECLEGYARLSPEEVQNKCYCTLADSNQMDVIAALHQRCELLSKKICEVVREISKENVFAEPGSMDVLRDFIRSVSSNMVDEDDTINRFGKSISALVTLQNKPPSVKGNPL